MRTKFGLVLFLALLLAITCDKKPSEPEYDNPFDLQNRQTGGDPFLLTAHIANGGITLNWTVPVVTGLNGYKIYRSETEQGGYILIQAVDKTKNSYVDMDIENGHSYWYKISAVNNKGMETAYTNTAAVNIITDPMIVINGGDEFTPGRTVNLTILANTASQMILSNNSDFSGSIWESFVTSKEWIIPTGVGEKVVYLKIKYTNGNESTVISDTINPQPMNPGVIIVGNVIYTTTRNVQVTLNAIGYNLSMRISEDSTFTGIDWQLYSGSYNYLLSLGDGEKTLYAMIKNDFEIESEKVFDDIILDSTPPVISLFVAPDSGITDETEFQFDPIACSDNLSSAQELLIRFDWQNDGSYDTGWSGLQITRHIFDTGGGNKQVNMQLRDAAGWQVDTTKILFVNSRPIASFTAIKDADNDKLYHFDASTSSDYEDGTDLYYRWDFNNDGNWEIDFGPDKKVDYEYMSDGNYTVVMETMDKNSAVNRMSLGIRISPEPVQMIYVNGGTFTMGDTWGDGFSDEQPTHLVTLNSFYMSQFEITQALWQQVMDDNPSYFFGPNRPVEQVNWYDAVKFCNKFSQLAGLDSSYIINGTDVVCNFFASGYRLPTEAE